MGAPDESSNELVGQHFGRYLLRYAVARGGMATVYLAQLLASPGFEKWVAVKIIHPHLAKDKRFVDMFLDEARVASRIQHPSVCSVIDFGQEHDLPYLVMEYLHGESFGTVARRGAHSGFLPAWLAARVVADAARGLHAAHELRKQGEPLGVVHRDVSPQNVMVLYDGLTKVLDFGVARARGRLSETRTGEVKGKFSYMAPEMLRSTDIDRRCDVWALGVVLWEALTGRRLFRGESEGATVLNVLESKIPKPSAMRPEVPRLLDVTVMQALRRDPKRRTATAADMADELEEYLATLDHPTGHAHVAEWMSAHFADKLGARDAMLRSQPIPSDTIPEVDLDSVGSMSSHVTSSGGTRQNLRKQRRDRRRRWRRAGAAAAAAAAVVAGAAVWVWTGATETETGSAAETGVEAPEMEPATATETETEAVSATEAEPGSGTGTDSEHEAATETASDNDTASETASETETGTATRRRRLRRGRLSLLAIPSATVTWRGRQLGETPLAEVTLPAGRHRLVLTPEGGGKSKTVVVTVRPGAHTRRSVRLDE